MTVLALAVSIVAASLPISCTVDCRIKAAGAASVALWLTLLVVGFLDVGSTPLLVGIEIVALLTLSAAAWMVVRVRPQAR